MANTEEEEDFSFPTITDTPPRFIESPPLWHRTSSTSFGRERPAPKGDDKGGESSSTANSIKNKQRKSFSYVERSVKGAKEDGSEDEEEEKMDMLWEDFNEEVYSKTYGSGLEYSNTSSPGRVADFGCVKLSKTGGGTVFSGKKPSVVVFVKVLKKLFLLHNSQSSLKKRTW